MAEKPNISIVMPFYGKWELCHTRLYELRVYVMSKHINEIILVDDCSPNPGEYAGQVAWWKDAVKTLDDRSKIKYYRLEENIGFGGAMNFGASKAKGDVIIFLSNDVVVKGDFVQVILEILNIYPDSLVGAEMIDWDSGWNVVDGKILKYLNGWLLACTKEVWKDLGGFDPRYTKFDVEDLDLSTTARRKGYELISFEKKFVRHIGSQTIGDLYPNRVEATKKNIVLLKEKWAGKLDELR